MKKFLFLGLSLLSLTANAAEDPAILKIKEKLPEIKSENFDQSTIKKSDIEGLYEVHLNNGKVIYVDKEASHFVVGNIFVNVNNTLLNKTKQDGRIYNKSLVDEIKKDHKDSLVYFPSTAEEKKGSIFVFSDFTCPYCRKLHNDLPLINKAGIDVYYIPFPKNSLSDINVVKGLQKIICSTDPAIAYSSAFRNPKLFISNITFEDLNCPQSMSVINFHEYGNKLNIQGTPAIVTEGGSLIQGYNDALSFVTELKRNMDEEKMWSNIKN